MGPQGLEAPLLFRAEMYQFFSYSLRRRNFALVSMGRRGREEEQRPKFPKFSLESVTCVET